MKYLLFSDLHIGLNINKEPWDKLPLIAVQEIHDCAIKNNIESIIFLGDLFHTKKEHSTKSIDLAIEIGKLLEKFETHLICGNHDVYYKNTLELSSLKIFEKFSNIHVHYEPYILNNKIGLCPWSCNYNTLNTSILMGHFDIKEFKMNNTIISEVGENPKNFKDYDLVLSGHYHTPSENYNIKYLGSVYQHNFNDINSKRGYYIFDDEILSLEFIEFTSSPKFIYVYDNIYNKEDITNNIIKIFFSNKLSENEISTVIQDISLLNPLEISTNYSKLSFDEISINTENIELLNEIDLLYEYLDKIEIPDYINKSFCKKIIEKII